MGSLSKLDEEKITEEEKYDGYYAVATNLLDPAKDIPAVFHRRYHNSEGMIFST